MHAIDCVINFPRKLNRNVRINNIIYFAGSVEFCRANIDKCRECRISIVRVFFFFRDVSVYYYRGKYMTSSNECPSTYDKEKGINQRRKHAEGTTDDR